MALFPYLLIWRCGGIILILVSWDDHQKWFEIPALPRGSCGGIQWGQTGWSTVRGASQLSPARPGAVEEPLLYTWVGVSGSDEFRAPSPHAPVLSAPGVSA